MPVQAGRVSLGDDPDAASDAVKSAIESRLGVTLADNRLRRIVRSLLVEQARTDGTRWKPLQPDSDKTYRIWLGGLFDQFPRIAGGATVSDNFDRADAGTLGASWNADSGTIGIVSNKAKVSAAAAWDRYGTQLATTDHYSQADVTWPASGRTGVLVRGQDANNHYWASYNAGSSLWQIIKWVAALASVVSSASASITSGITIKLQASGSSLTLFNGGSSVLTGTDTALTTGKYVGIREQAVTNSTWDNWTASDLAGPGALPFQTPRIRRALMRSAR